MYFHLWTYQHVPFLITWLLRVSSRSLFYFLNFSTFPFLFCGRHFVDLPIFLCDDCIHFINEIDCFFYSHIYFEWIIVITSGFIKHIISKFYVQQHYGKAFSCMNHIGLIFRHVSSNWFSHDVETWIYFFLQFLNYSEIYMIEEETFKLIDQAYKLDDLL